MDRSGALRYNLTCSTDDGRIADWIANQLEKDLGLENISATGIVFGPDSLARVLTVIKKPAEVPPYKVLEAAKALGRRFAVDIIEADIIGEIPLEVVLDCAEYALSVRQIRSSQVVNYG
ncbi:MAG: hypothetical protein ACOX2P_00340 [Bacillota bacterium]|jgi:glutamate formiminotransferase